jgi:tetratricopeptide (TPR) repeat protein
MKFIREKYQILVPAFCLALLVMLSVLGYAKGEDTAITKFDRANKYYQQQDYENAIKSYEEVLKGNHISAGVYYNLGNAYFKTGNIAKSVLNYERAHKLAPDDEDIDFNLKLAALKVVDKIDPVPMVFYRHWINSAALALAMDSWSKVFLGLLWVTVFLFALFIIASSPFRKKLFFIVGLIFLVLTFASYYFTTVQDNLVNHDQHAIIMTASSYVKSSPDEKGNDQFILHEGTKVEVLDEFNDWRKIKIANGTVGWIKFKDIEII